MISNEESMQDTLNENDYEEVWIVVMNTRGRYKLSKDQARIVQKALVRGERGAIVFETFAISIPYIAEFFREKRFLKHDKVLPERATEGPFVPISKERLEKFKEEIYRKLGKSPYKK